MNNKLELLVKKKIDNFQIEFYNKLDMDFDNTFTLLNYLSSNKQYILYIYTLFIKYSSIINIENKNIINENLIRNLYYVKRKIDNYNYESMISSFNADTKQNFDSSKILYFKLEELYELYLKNNSLNL